MTSGDLTTVMGPGPSVAPNKIFDPPKLMPTTDKLLWRKKVRLWAKTVKTLARGGDPKAVSAYNAMPYTLYQSIDDTYGAKLEGAIDAGLLTIEPEENEGTDPVVTIERIIQLVAKDSITDTVRRDVSMLKEIHGCKRKDGEATATFAHRYEGLTLRYINNCDILGAKQISQSFAMILLDNAKISSSVYNTVISQMVARANERGQEAEKLLIVPKETAQKTDVDVEKLIDTYKAFETENELFPNADDPLLQLMMQIKRDVSKINMLKPYKDSEDRPKVRLTLEDAIQALSDVRIDEVSEKQTVHTDIRLQGSMLGKRKYGNYVGHENNGYARYGGDQKTKGNFQPFDPSKQKCRMCKRRGHFYKDPSCICNQVRAFLAN